MIPGEHVTNRTVWVNPSFHTAAPFNGLRGTGNLRIFGLDFNHGEPIACTSAALESGVLHVHCLATLDTLDTFENFLNSQGPWVAGVDFPFGQPRELVKNLGWPMGWEDCVVESEILGLEGFEKLLQDYRDARPLGDKHYLRAVDSLANAAAPTSLRQIPLSKLFQCGAPRLLRSPVSVLPCRPNQDNRVVLEAYPAIVARRLVKRPYKGARNTQPNRLQINARRALLDRLLSQALEDEFSIRIALDASIRDELVEEPTGDFLGALLCSIQAAWAWTRREQDWGIPAEADCLEGWIVDPALAIAHRELTADPPVPV